MRVDQGSAGVAPVNGRIGLNKVFKALDPKSGAAHGADDAHRDSLFQSERIADRQNYVAYLCMRRIRECQRCKTGLLDLQYRDVAVLIGANNLRWIFDLVEKRYFDV